jgi:ribosomal protein S18 acetylase RimI-like enzyme
MPRIRVENTLGPTRRRAASGLLAFNTRTVGKGQYKPLAISLRRGNDIVGGLTGWTWVGWCYVELLWIEEKYRGRGHGTALIRKAESEARKRGVKHMYLDTFSFQAPRFYRKLGFKAFGILKDFPKGHDRTWFKKAL